MGLQTIPIRQTIFYKWLQQRLSIFQEPLDHQMQLLDRKFPKLAFSSHWGIIMNSADIDTKSAILTLLNNLRMSFYHLDTLNC